MTRVRPDPAEVTSMLAELTVPEDLAETFGRFALELESAEGTEATVETISRYALRVLACDRVGISLAAASGGIAVAHTTDAIVARVLRWQLEVGDGPMLHAFTSAVAVHITDPATDTRWPLWSRLVAELPMNAIMHVPLTNGRAAIGALSLYHDRPHAFGRDDEELARILALHASLAMTQLRHEEQLAEAMDTHKLVGQAMGILIERNDLTSDQAFDELRRRSQHAHLTHRATAQEIIATRATN
ncbi:GAF and ANTAR domain-containing protein [Kribbella sp. NPDC054772]